MKMNEPIANALYGPLFIRLTLGSYFIAAGMLKLDQPPGAFVEEIRKFGILKEPLVTLYGTLLPYLEICSGALLILGFFTTLAALTSSLLLLSFVIAFKFFPEHPHLLNKVHRHQSCGWNKVNIGAQRDLTSLSQKTVFNCLESCSILNGRSRARSGSALPTY